MGLENLLNFQRSVLISDHSRLGISSENSSENLQACRQNDYGCLSSIIIFVTRSGSK